MAPRTLLFEQDRIINASTSLPDAQTFSSAIWNKPFRSDSAHTVPSLSSFTIANCSTSLPPANFRGPVTAAATLATDEVRPSECSGRAIRKPGLGQHKGP